MDRDLARRPIHLAHRASACLRLIEVADKHRFSFTATGGSNIVAERLQGCCWGGCANRSEMQQPSHTLSTARDRKLRSVVDATTFVAR